MPYTLKIALLLLDILLLNFALSLVSVDFASGSGFTSDGIYLAIFSNLTWFYLALVAAPYHLHKGLSIRHLIKTKIVFLCMHVLVIVSLMVLFRKSYSLEQVIRLYAILIPGFFLVRLLTFFLRKQFSHPLERKNYILIGRNWLAEETRRNYLLARTHIFCGYFDFPEDERSLRYLKDLCSSRNIHIIICCVPGDEMTDLRPVIEFGLDTLVKVEIVTASRYSESLPLKVLTDRYSKIDRHSLPLESIINEHVKRAFDILFAGCFIALVMIWLTPLIAFLIKLDSKGPVFFLQLRSGKGGKNFWCIKFRSMRTNVDANNRQATKGDPRVTRLGAFLRKSSIDELPQFFNVLWGTMSVVGPRPHMLRHTEEYSATITWYMGRHHVKPGITGLAQCMGYRGETQTVQDMENRVRLDRYYIENWSFWLDIKIIFLTIVSLIRGSDKAY
jgi:Undecaprenyl-phosphate glucose phosphotransferase